MPSPFPLHDLQRWMQTVITHPDGVSAGISSSDAAKSITISLIDLDRVIQPSREMSSLDRLQIYGRAYFGRLIECLKAQFPAVLHAIGNEAFDGLAFGYLIQHPSRTYTLSSLGDSFDAFLLATRPARIESPDADKFDFADFLVDLAKLERIYSEVFNGSGPERSRSLQASDFENLSAEDFANCRLIPHDCVRLVELRFPVHEYATSVRLGTDPQLSASRAVYLVVTRREYIVRRFEVTRTQFDLLSSIVRQATIGESLQLLCAHENVDLNSLAIQLRTWFQNWSAAPLFAELCRGSIDSPER